MKTYRKFLERVNDRGYEIPETKSLSEDEFFDLLKDCDSIDGNYLKIYRSVYLTDDFYFINNENFERRSAYSSNQYTLWINHHEEWKDYPKRKLICSIKYPRTFGSNSYIVIPFKNSKWGIVPSEDIQNITNIYDLNDLNIDDQDFDDMMSDLELNYEYDDVKIDTPEKLGFHVCDYKDIPKYTKNENYEIWTDSNVLLIRSDIFKNYFSFYDEIEVKYINKLRDYIKSAGIDKFLPDNSKDTYHKFLEALYDKNPSRIKIRDLWSRFLKNRTTNKSDRKIIEDINDKIFSI